MFRNLCGGALDFLQGVHDGAHFGGHSLHRVAQLGHRFQPRADFISCCRLRVNHFVQTMRQRLHGNGLGAGNLLRVIQHAPHFSGFAAQV